MSLRVAKVPGSKWTLADWIVGHMVPRPVYLDAYFGSGALLYAKPRCATEIVNDRDDRVVALFRCVRDRPDELARVVRLTPYARAEWQACRPDVDDELEKARRFLVLGWQSHGHRTLKRSGWRRDGARGRRKQSFAREWSDIPTRITAATERLRGVLIENRPALSLLRTYRAPETFAVLDPPYPQVTSQGVRDALYRHEMLDVEQHEELLTEALVHPGPLIACSYRNELYDRMLLGAGWEVREHRAWGEHSVERVEAIYLNRVLSLELKQARQCDLFGRTAA